MKGARRESGTIKQNSHPWELIWRRAVEWAAGTGPVFLAESENGARGGPEAGARDAVRPRHKGSEISRVCDGARTNGFRGTINLQDNGRFYEKLRAERRTDE